jgi:hypothetical protein
VDKNKKLFIPEKMISILAEKSSCFFLREKEWRFGAHMGTSDPFFKIPKITFPSLKNI